jgi:hypothetical protein
VILQRRRPRVSAGPVTVGAAGECSAYSIRSTPESRRPILPHHDALHAVSIARPGPLDAIDRQLAERPGLARPVVVPAGSADTLLSNRRVIELLYLGAVVLLLFEDPAEGAAFEVKLAQIRARSARTKVFTPWAPKTRPALARNQRAVSRIGSPG